MKKSDVNGEHQLPLYAYLKSRRDLPDSEKVAKAAALGIMLRKIDKNYKENPDIKWNFTKFLVDRQGTVVVRFEPTGDVENWKNRFLHYYRSKITQEWRTVWNEWILPLLEPRDGRCVSNYHESEK